MSFRLRRIALASLLLLASPYAAAQATEAFRTLATLVGVWERSDAEGGYPRASFHLTAGGSVLAETYAMSSTRESMTMYSIDDGHLLATHYCPQGNQPRLALERTDPDGTLRFVFRDGGNLQDADGSHQHAMWIRMHGPARFIRSETYVANSALQRAIGTEGEAVEFRRIEPGTR